MTGFDAAMGKIANADRAILLVDRDKITVASSAFKAIMAHRNRKHAKTANGPSPMCDPPPIHSHGPIVRMKHGGLEAPYCSCEVVDFLV